jgi:hypothetical protein
MTDITAKQLVDRIEKAILRAGEGLSSFVKRGVVEDLDNDIDEIANGLKCALVDNRTLRRRHFPEEKND